MASNNTFFMIQFIWLFLYQNQLVMDNEYKLVQLESKINKVSENFDVLKESISYLPTIVLACFLSGLIVGLLIGFL